MQTEKVSLKEKIGYGLGDAASSMFWKLFGMYLLFFYTDIFGLPATVVGTMFLITRIWDSFFDPIVGVIADRTHSRWGKFRPYILYFSIPFGLIGILTFSTPDFGPSGKIIYAYITYSLMMMVYSMINVPYASLLGVMTSNTNTRTQLSSYRMIFAFAGSLLALLLIQPLVDFFSGSSTQIPDLQNAWQLSLIVFAVIAALFFFGTFYLCKERVEPIKAASNTLKEDIKDLIANRPWWILLGAGISALIFNSIRDGAAVYYFKYFVTYKSDFSFFGLNIPLTLTTLYLVIGQGANIVGILLISPISIKIGKKMAYLGSMALATILSIAFYFLDKNDIALIFVVHFLISMCAGSIFPLLWSMYADTADYSEQKTGRRATGLIFSSSSMSQKFGWSLGGALTGWLLGFYGFQANVLQTVEATTGIVTMMSLLPAAGTILSVLFIFFYPLNEKKMAEVEVKLTEMRNK
jgi:GPH family glycoside/pentoside/hexuronide:cation symporter